MPGVLFANRPIVTETPGLIDIPYSIMKLFGHEPPKYMQGQMVFADKGQEGTVRGMLDPSTLEQSGAPVGALAVPDAELEATGK